MLQLVHLDRLEERLRAVPAVVDVQHRREFAFPQRVLAWLVSTEQVMNEAHLHAVSQIAASRSELLSAMHGAVPTPTVGRRKLIEYTASEVLRRAQQVVTSAIESRLEQLHEAQAIATRVVAVARAKGVLDQAQSIPSHQQKLEFVLRLVSQDPDTAAATVHLTGIVGPIDALVVLDRAMPELTPPEATRKSA